jgi:P4 family phage/plasmid primase-like protien
MQTNFESHKISQNEQNPEAEVIIPSLWFAKKFPDVADKHGESVEESVINRRVFVKTLNEDFMAETIGNLGDPKAPTVFATAENKFYTYVPEQGIYVFMSENQILTRLSTLLRECADACEGSPICDPSAIAALRFKLGKSAQLRGVINKAKGHLHVTEDYFNTDLEKFLPCNNGMLRLADMELLDFGPQFRRRNKLAVNYDSTATCEIFERTLMSQALGTEDISLLQKWFGLALLGTNLSHVIVILTGTAGGGKSTFVSIVAGVIGKENVVSLRTEQLNQRFEISGYLGKTLLSGADVAADFLSSKNASILKALTGGDPMTVEIKNGNVRPEIIGNFNIIITSNSNLVIRLEGDTEAWRRRLAIVEYKKPKPGKVIAQLADMILKQEGSGVLNWALQGLKQLRDDGWCIHLSSSQRGLVDKALLESESPRVFAEQGLEQDENSELTWNDCFAAYVAFCKERNWTPLARGKASNPIEKSIITNFGLSQRNDIVGPTGRDQRGWKGLRIKGPEPKNVSDSSAANLGQNGRLVPCS